MKTSPEEKDNDDLSLRSKEDDLPLNDETKKDDNDIIDETTTTIETLASDNNVWAAQGYTPLQDLNFTRIMTAAADEEEHGVLFSAEGGGAVFATHHTDLGTLFAEMSGFDNDDELSSNDQDDGNNETRVNDDKVLNANGLFDFRNVANQALKSLEDDYFATLQGQVRTSTLEETVLRPPLSSSSHDIKDTADSFEANFDVYTTEAMDDTATAGESDQNKESLSTSSPTTSLNDNKSQTPQKIAVDIDDEAVRKAVQAISLRDPKLTNALQDWEQDQKEAMARVPCSHSLIPTAPLKAFRKQTPKADQAAANLSRSATIAEALVRLGILKQQDEIVIDIVGCDHVECASVERIQTLFAPVVRWLGVSPHAPVEMRIRLIGPNMPPDALQFSPIVLLVDEESRGLRRLQKAVVSCHLGVYNDFLDEETQSGDLVMCFNAGIWGYTEWRDTIQYLLKRKEPIPIIVTSYTLQEAEDDYEVIQDEVVKYVGHDKTAQAMRLVFEPEYNPYRSKIDRPTKTAVEGRCYRENNAWQAWRL